jgi:hypothetical protein
MSSAWQYQLPNVQERGEAILLPLIHCLSG